MSYLRTMTAARAALLMVTAGAGAALPAQAANSHGYNVAAVMSGLVTPRGLAFGPDGGLYVTEAGNGSGGASGPSVVLGNGNTAYFGQSSALSSWSGGVQSRVLGGLPSLATAAGMDAAGLQDIVFDGTGQAYGLFALGTSATQRNNSLGTSGAQLGTIVKLDLGSAARTIVADIAQNATQADSNPFGLARNAAGNFIVADAGANSFLEATLTGDVTTLAVLPPKPNPSFPGLGPPVYSSVPTAIELGPDGAYYIGQLTGFPFPPGAANVFRYDPSSADLSVAYSNFTNIIDLSFDSQGNLYVLQISDKGLASGQAAPGLLSKIDAHGQRSVVADQELFFPGGLTIGPDDALYVSTVTNLPAGGQVLRITPVPEPGTWGLMLAGMAGVVATARRRQAGRGSPKVLAVV